MDLGRQALDILEIQQLRSAYTWCLDTPDIDALIDLFADDAHCEFGPYGSWDGKEELRAGFSENTSAPGDPFLTMHITANHLVELQGEDRATGRIYLLGQILSQEQGPDGILGHYEDIYRKVDGRWLFADVRLAFHWSSDVGRIAGEMAQKQQSFVEARAAAES
jgi:hypothetical protein